MAMVDYRFYQPTSLHMFNDQQSSAPIRYGRTPTTLRRHLHSLQWVDQTLKFAEVMQQQGAPISRELAYTLVHECAQIQDLDLCRRVQYLMVCNGLDTVSALADHLVRLFASRERLVEANLAYNKIVNPSFYTWSAIIMANTSLHEGETALQLCHRIYLGGTQPDNFALSSILKACAVVGDIEPGRYFHEQITDSTLKSDIVLGSTLVDMYAKCGNMAEAVEIFQKLQIRDVVTCSSIIIGYAQNGEGLLALGFLEKMQEFAIKPNKVTYIGILKACGNMGTVLRGRQIHEQVLEMGLQCDVTVGSTLINMYFRCGDLLEAQRVFDRLPKKNLVTWGAMIVGYAQHGEGLLALQCFNKMQDEGMKPGQYTFSSGLKACGSIGAIVIGRSIHEQIIENEFESDVIVGNTLVDMYIKCMRLDEAGRVFESLNRDLVTWCSVITGYAQLGEGQLAIEYFYRMQSEGVKPNKVAYWGMLKACGSVNAIQHGRHIHEQIIACGGGPQIDIVMGNTILDMYLKIGSMEEALNIFSKLTNRDMSTWCLMIAGCAQYGEGLLAVKVFDEMEAERIKPDKFIVSSLLKACASIRDLQKGKQIHEWVIKTGMHMDIVVENSLVDMYAKCGDLKKAREVFDSLTNLNVITWGTMIAGYTEHGEGLLALECFHRMQCNGICSDNFTFSSILKACGILGAIEKGKQVHQQIVQSGVQFDITVGNQLVDMYAKCGNMDQARIVFDKLQNRNIMSWGAMLAGYALCHNVRLAEQCFEEMQRQGIRPNGATFASILATCSHTCSLEKGLKYFQSMKAEHDITPQTLHYNCIIDLLGRSGCLNEAWKLVQIIQPDITSWTALLSACRTYGHVNLGRHCFDQIMHLDPQHAGAYVLMSGIYSDACMGEDSAKIEELRQSACAWKKPARTWIEVDNNVHEFIVGDKNHPQSKEVNIMLKRLSSRLKEAGYKPKLELVLNKITDKEKEDALCGHSEKLAIAFGLISTLPGTVIRATKNLSMCMDCHNATKIISKIEMRDIIIKDAHCIHHFANGICSCQEY